MRGQKDKFDKLPAMPHKSFFRRHAYAWLGLSHFVDQAPGWFGSFDQGHGRI